MKLFFDTDYLFITLIVVLSFVEALDSWLRIFLVIVGIIAGIYKIVQTHYDIKEKKKRIKENENT